MRTLVALLAFLVPAIALAQPASTKFVGSWAGTIKQGEQDVEIVLNVAPADTGGYRAFVDIPVQNVRGMSIPGAQFTGPDLVLPLGQARFEGRIDAAGNSIAGKVIGAGGEQAFTFDRRGTVPVLPAVEAAIDDPDGVAGDFAGDLQVGGGIAASLHIRRTADGYVAALDIPSQSAVGLAADTVTLEDRSLTVTWGFGSYRGTFSEDLSSIDGTWTQSGRDIELDLVRAAAQE